MAKQETSLLMRTVKPRFFYGYIVVVVAASIQLVGWGIVDVFGVFFKPLLTEFGWTRAIISGAASLCLLVHGFAGIIVGGLSDRFGPRIVMTALSVIYGLGLLLMSRVSTIWQLYLFYGVVVGIGVSGMDVILLSTTARWFVKRRGMMSGIVKVGTGVGILIMPLVASMLISAYGWRNSYSIAGVASLVFIVSAAQFLRRDPREIGQLPDGEEETKAGSLNLVEVGLSLREAIHTGQFWMICVAYLIISFCAHTILVHIVPHAGDLGISATNAASVLSVIGGASIASRFIMGSAGDRIGHKRALLVCFFILVTALSWLQVARELRMLYLFAVIYGFNHGGFFALISPLVAGLFGTRSQGTLLGIIIFSGTIGGSISTILSGHIFDITGSYQLAFLILLILAIIGLILTTLLRPIGEGSGK